MRLITKLILLVVFMLVTTVVISVLGIVSINDIGDDVGHIASKDIPVMRDITAITHYQLEQSLWLERAIASEEMNKQEGIVRAENEFIQRTKLVTENLDKVIQLLDDLIKLSENESIQQTYKDQKNMLIPVSDDNTQYTSLTGEYFSFLNRGDTQSARVLVQDIKSKQSDIAEQLQVITTTIGTFTEKKVVRTEEKEAVASISMFVVSTLSFIVFFALALWILKSIRKQLGRDPSELEQIAKQLAEGELDIEHDANADGVYGAISRTVDKLINVIQGIIVGSYEVSVASEQVSQGNANLSQRTQEQASSLEEVASSMEEMISTVNQNSENAQQANQLAREAKQQAEKGGEIVEEAVNAMRGISQSSGKISEIISVIDDIAFQTNLLALNAAVEAARAGEQGRGFAVVASEVRNLAGRSATAAKQIKGLITDSVGRVEYGQEQVGRSGEALNEILVAVKKVSDIVAEIAAASKEQSEGINQVNKALLQMDSMTQQNASLVEQAAAASEAMGLQARQLNELVSYFQIDKNAIDGGSIENVYKLQHEKTTEQGKLNYTNNEEARAGVNQLMSNSVKEQNDDSEWQDF